MIWYQKLKDLGIILPAHQPVPAGAYRPVIVSGDTAYLSGQVSRAADGSVIQGRIGADLSLAEGQAAAKAAAIALLSVLMDPGLRDSIDRFLRITGYVRCAENFSDIHLVLNGASELILAVFGNAGIHARSAVGAASLPLSAAVEVEAIVKLRGV